MSTYVELGSAHTQLNTTAAPPSQEMDKDMFMQLMITQLQYQDPLNPMDNQEMLAQLAQFSALEQMQNVASVNEKQYAQQMIGKFVEYQYQDPETGGVQYLVGKVDYVRYQGNEQIMGIGGHEVPLNQISQVIDSNNIQADTSAFELINKTIQAVIEKENEETGLLEEFIIEGEVLQVHMKDEEPYVVVGVGDQRIEIALGDVQNIVDKPSLTDKYVTGTITQIDEEGNATEVEITGKVDYIVMSEDESYLCVDGQYMELDNLISVYNQKPQTVQAVSKYNY